MAEGIGCLPGGIAIAGGQPFTVHHIVLAPTSERLTVWQTALEGL